MLQTDIIYCGRPRTVTCDSRCDKAWGINSRPSIQLSDDEEDTAYLADDELGTAPDVSPIQEGGDNKPRRPTVHNKWCVRECERLAYHAWIP